MRASHLGAVVLRLAGLLGALAVVVAGLAAPAATQAQPAPATLDWRYYGNDLGNTRYQNVDQITPANVATLVPIWIFHTGDTDGEVGAIRQPRLQPSTAHKASTASSRAARR